MRSLVAEIKEGISRADSIVLMLGNNTFSFSRIYTDLWRSTNQELASKLEEHEVLILLHRIYYRFDLVNFNFEQNRLEAAAAFAKEYQDEMRSNLATLEKAVARW